MGRVSECIALEFVPGGSAGYRAPAGGPGLLSVRNTTDLKILDSTLFRALQKVTVFDFQIQSLFEGL